MLEPMPSVWPPKRTAVRPSGRAFGVLFGVGLLLVAACGDDPAPEVLQPTDLEEGEAGSFDPDDIIDAKIFQESDLLDLDAVQKFLAKTPYGRSSFLETYQSNGIRAADAIVAAARKYKINPFVFLTYAQVTQGLVGITRYPSPPERVEYVFGCGCLETNNCLPTYAGFDIQVDCLGQALRTSLDEIKANKKTTSGWAVGSASLTLDGVDVTPKGDATAAIYDRTPRVNEGKAGGTWIVWNVFHRYAADALSGVITAGSASVYDTRWVGEACTSTLACSGYDDPICADNYTDGLCTAKCSGDCPSESGRPETFCAKFADGAYCLATCNPASPDCRKGYQCVSLPGPKGSARNVCSPG